MIANKISIVLGDFMPIWIFSRRPYLLLAFLIILPTVRMLAGVAQKDAAFSNRHSKLGPGICRLIFNQESVLQKLRLKWSLTFATKIRRDFCGPQREA